MVIELAAKVQQQSGIYIIIVVSECFFDHMIKII